MPSVAVRVHHVGVHPSVRVRVSSRAVSVRPPSHPSGPASARRRRLGDTLVRRGNPHAWNESSSMWSGPVPAARSTARVGLDAAPLRRSCVGQRGSVGRGPGRVVLGRVAAADRPGGPDRRKGAHRQRLRQAGVLAEARRSRTRRLAAILAGARLRSVVVVEPDAGVDGLGRANELDGADGRAAPARPRCAGGAPGLALAAL
jgi:hypothetical protein